MLQTFYEDYSESREDDETVIENGKSSSSNSEPLTTTLKKFGKLKNRSYIYIKKLRLWK